MREIEFFDGDICGRALVRSVFEKIDIEAVIHLVGLKAVGESVDKPLMYFENNVYGSGALFEVEVDCKSLVFSSSATVYGDSASVSIGEDFSLSTRNSYSASKLMVEDIYCDVSKSDDDWSIALLPYINTVGAHESGLIGEDLGGSPII